MSKEVRFVPFFHETAEQRNYVEKTRKLGNRVISPVRVFRLYGMRVENSERFIEVLKAKEPNLIREQNGKIGFSARDIDLFFQTAEDSGVELISVVPQSYRDFIDRCFRSLGPSALSSTK